MTARRSNLPTIAQLLAAAGLAAGFAAQAQDVSGDVGRGEELFHQFACYSCHGYNGTGRRPLANGSSGILSNERVFLSYLRLRADQNPVNPKNTMPNYSVESLSDDQALDIFAYLVSLEDNPPALEEIDVMQDILNDAERETRPNE